MKEKILTNDKTQTNINIPASGETSQTYTQNSSAKSEDLILKRRLGFRNKFLPIFLLLLILFTIIVAFAFMKLRGQIDTSNTIPQSSSITKISPTATPVAEMPTNTQSITQIPKPIYKSGEFLTSVHFAQGFSIGYPADLIPELRGAGGGNFFLEIGDTNSKSSILVYPQYPKQDLSKLNLENVTELSYDYWGSEPKIIPPEEKIITKEQVNIGGIRAYKVVSNIERIIVPKEKSVLVIEIQNKNIATGIIDKITNTFSLISPIPTSWELYSDTKIKGFKIKHPADYKIDKKDNPITQSYDVIFTSPEGNISFSFFNDTSPVKQYFASADRYSYNVNAAIQAEQFLKEDITNAKFNQNAFTFAQGGDSAIRVVHPAKQDFNLYFYLFGIPSIKINAPSKLEPVVNQMLMSLNEEYNK